MAQESWKIDNEEPGCQPPEGPRLCYNNCGFFGSSTTMNLCSQCYRDVVLKQAKATEAAAVISTVHSELPVPGIGRQPQPESTLADEGSFSQSVEAESSKAALPSEQLPLQPNRCFSCKKHLGLLGFKCRCGYLFCSLHRYNDKHNCSFDYRAAARDAIAKANPVVKADKLDKI